MAVRALLPEVPRSRLGDGSYLSSTGAQISRGRVQGILLITVVALLGACTSAPEPSATRGTAVPPSVPLSSAPREDHLDTPASRGPSATYTADWSAGLGGWAGSPQWKAVDGRLLSDGTAARDGGLVRAPFRPDSRDYAIESRIRLLRSDFGCYFGIVGRLQGDPTNDGLFMGYSTIRGFGGVAVHTYDGFREDLARDPAFSPGSEERNYRAEFRGNEVRLLVDGAEILRVKDNRFLDPGMIGLASGSCQIEVSTFAVSPIA